MNETEENKNDYEKVKWKQHLITKHIHGTEMAKFSDRKMPN